MYILLGLIALISLVFYRFYYKPKTEIAKQITLYKSLGYSVYEVPFAFLGLSFMNQWEKGISQHRDALQFERTVFPQVDIVIGNIFDKVAIFLVKPDLIKEFLSVKTIEKYPKFQTLVEGIKQTIGIGITLSEGQLWKNKRKLMSKVFDFDLVKDNTSKICEICDRCYDRYEKNYQVGENTFKYDPVDISSNIFNGVMMKCFFGSDLVQQRINGKAYQEFVTEISTLSSEVALSPIMGLLGKTAWNLGLSAKIRQLKVKVGLLREKSKEILKKHVEEILKLPKPKKNTDIIQALVYEKIDNKQQFSYSDEDIIAEFQTFLVAGTDTTSRFFTMMVYYLGTYPLIQEKLRRQVESIIKSDEDITYDNIKKLTYLDWIHNETTRFFGPAPFLFFRVATEDNYLCNIPVKKGSIVNYQAKGNHFNPKYFKNPEEFRPQRWEKECDGIDPYAFLGFSAGARGCIGKHLAYLESKIAIVKLLRRYKTIQVPNKLTMKVGLVYEAEHFDAIYTR